MGETRKPYTLADVIPFLGFHLCMALPGGWRGEPWRSIELWLLPIAVDWAYRDHDARPSPVTRRGR